MDVATSTMPTVPMHHHKKENARAVIHQKDIDDHPWLEEERFILSKSLASSIDRGRGLPSDQLKASGYPESKSVGRMIEKRITMGR